MLRFYLWLSGRRLLEADDAFLNGSVEESYENQILDKSTFVVENLNK